MEMHMKIGNLEFRIVVEKDENGYFAFCPELQGCYTQGNSYEEVIENIKDAIMLHIEDEAMEDEIKEIEEYERREKERKLKLEEI